MPAGTSISPPQVIQCLHLKRGSKIGKRQQLLGHAKSEAHTNVMLAWAEYEKSTASTSSLSASLNAEYNKLVKENREYIKIVVAPHSYAKHCTEST